MSLSVRITRRLRRVMDQARIMAWPAPKKATAPALEKVGAGAVSIPEKEPKAKVPPTPKTSAKPTLDPQLVDLFCGHFGEEHRERLTPATDMDDIDGWDSQSFLGFVLTLEEAYGLTFSDAEATQMFQLGHIQRILRNAKLDRPHDDVAHACCQIYQLKQAPSEALKMVILSGSSTREGFVSPSEGRDMLRRLSGDATAELYNMSISGLVVAETLQLLEVIKSVDNALVLVGWSPIILGGCGEAEFKRAASHERFPFAAAKMDRILKQHGYTAAEGAKTPSISLEEWIERYLKGRALDALHYEPYLYPTLKPWDADKFRDEESILRFYNHALANYEQSLEVNQQLFHEIVALCAKRKLRLGLLNLTLQSELLAYLEKRGQVVSRTGAALERIQADTRTPFIDAVADAGITDADFRDPAHIMQKREAYTECAIVGALDRLGRTGG
jgi:acyl carrier protein